MIAEIYEIVLKVGDKKGQVATSIYNSIEFSSLCKKGTLIHRCYISVVCGH